MLDAGGKRRPPRVAAPQMDLIAEKTNAYRTTSLEQKVAVLKALGEGGDTGFALSELKAKVYLSGEALRAALSALVAEGTVLEKGKRPRRWAVANLQKQLL